VVGDDNKVVLKSLVTGRTMGSNWIVVSGLSAGDRVIVEGLQKVQPGATVKPVEAVNPEGRSVSAGVVTGPARSQQDDAKAAPAAGH
jgi:membrane fusion protein (multidrug efflux system)